ncbi:hypothetical protein DIPPA_02061 [Diplonema papillatum]|nr:hypothetical protein DIPPA_02061 [Diplonema papillatum]
MDSLGPEVPKQLKPAEREYEHLWEEPRDPKTDFVERTFRSWPQESQEKHISETFLMAVRGTLVVPVGNQSEGLLRGRKCPGIQFMISEPGDKTKNPPAILLVVIQQSLTSSDLAIETFPSAIKAECNDTTTRAKNSQEQRGRRGRRQEGIFGAVGAAMDSLGPEVPKQLKPAEREYEHGLHLWEEPRDPKTDWTFRSWPQESQEKHISEAFLMAVRGTLVVPVGNQSEGLLRGRKCPGIQFMISEPGDKTKNPPAILLVVLWHPAITHQLRFSN